MSKKAKIINYMAAYDVADKAKAEELGLSIKEIAEAEYAIVPVKGAIPASIHHAWKYVLEVFFPETGYRHSGAPDFEVYFKGDMSSPYYQNGTLDTSHQGLDHFLIFYKDANPTL